uniref:Uncharacterized protein n=1 Tax=Mycena chlorophos TaxID=658473 RepID=A0ABQ0MDS4_MYCCL|nr:predicted protein [Mycena chlorophos]
MALQTETQSSSDQLNIPTSPPLITALVLLTLLAVGIPTVILWKRWSERRHINARALVVHNGPPVPVASPRLWDLWCTTPKTDVVQFTAMQPLAATLVPSKLRSKPDRLQVVLAIAMPQPSGDLSEYIIGGQPSKHTVLQQTVAPQNALRADLLWFRRSSPSRVEHDVDAVLLLRAETIPFGPVARFAHPFLGREHAAGDAQDVHRWSGRVLAQLKVVENTRRNGHLIRGRPRGSAHIPDQFAGRGSGMGVLEKRVEDGDGDDGCRCRHRKAQSSKTGCGPAFSVTRKPVVTCMRVELLTS